MNAVDDDVRPWSKMRWMVSIGVVVAAQLGFVLALTIQAPLNRAAVPGTRITLPESVPADFQALTDPTLLALGSPQSFSAIWLERTNLPAVKVAWTQPHQWLEIESQTLGSQFLDFARSNRVSLHGLRFKSTPQVLPADVLSTAKPLRTASTLRVVGDLENRGPLRMPDLPSPPAADLLPPSEVRVLVDARGLVVSAILQSSSGSAEADRYALNQSRQMRFTPVAHGPTAQPLAHGRLVFEWHTAPLTDGANPAR